MLLYNKSQNTEYISQMLYRKERSSKVFKRMKELKEMGWIEKVTSKDKPEQTKDLRHRYYKTTSKWLIDKIKESGIQLKTKDEENLMNYFSSDQFRWWIGILFTDMRPWTNKRWFYMITDRLCASATFIKYLKERDLFETYKKMKDPLKFERKTELKLFTNNSLLDKLVKLNPSLSLFLEAGYFNIENIIIQKIQNIAEGKK